MEGRLPPDDDELFEWSDAPERPRRQPDPHETGERDRFSTAEREAARGAEPGSYGGPETGPGPGAGAPFDTGEQRPRRRRGINLSGLSLSGLRLGRLGRGRRERERDRARTRPATGEQPALRGDTGEYERYGRRPPPGRRTRRRDLPAKVRRRQDIAIGAGVIVLIVAGISLISGGGGGGGEETPLKRLVGQTIVGKLGKAGPSKALVKRVRKGQVGGLIALNPKPQALEQDVTRLQEAAKEGDNPPLLIMVDQEGGHVKRLPGPPDRSPPQLGRSADEGEAKDQGQRTGEYLSELGVNADLAPLLDVAHPQTAETIASRTYGTDAEVVSSVGVAFIEGLQDGGVVATAKHFPGLGAATQNTDTQQVTVAATKEDLEAGLQPFRDAIDAGVDMVMVSSAKYPTLGSRKEALFSPQLVNGLLRDDLGYDGVVITDDLESQAVESITTPGIAATGALEAGDDLLLYAGSDDASTKAFGALVDQVKKGNLDRALVQDAYDRITDLKSSLPSG